MSFEPVLQLRTLQQLYEDFSGPLPEQIKMLNMIYSLHTEAQSGVQSVNGKSDANIILTADDVGALPDTYTPPVVSVNGQTGPVSLDAADVGAEGEGTAVLLTGAQTVAGVKTFSSMPVITAGTARTGIPTVDQMYGNKIFRPTAASISADATLTGAQVLGGIIVADTTAALVNITMPTGSQLEAAINLYMGQIFTGDAIRFKIININGTFGSKILTNTGITLVGSSDISSWFYADCILLRTASNVYTLYRS